MLAHTTALPLLTKLLLSLSKTTSSRRPDYNRIRYRAALVVLVSRSGLPLFHSVDHPLRVVSWLAFDEVRLGQVALSPLFIKRVVRSSDSPLVVT